MLQFGGFDFDEFISYLIPGSLFVGALVLPENAIALGEIISGIDSGSNSNSTILKFFVFIGASLITGHFFSVISRYVWRPLTYLFVSGDPAFAIFSKNANSNQFFTDELNELIAKKFKEIFGEELSSPHLRRSIPRLIRSYVFAKDERAFARREKIVRSRLLCANFVTPLVVLSIVLPFQIVTVLKWSCFSEQVCG
jgi:hypothetical protein